TEDHGPGLRRWKRRLEAPRSSCAAISTAAASTVVMPASGSAQPRHALTLFGGRRWSTASGSARHPEAHVCLRTGHDLNLHPGLWWPPWFKRAVLPSEVAHTESSTSVIDLSHRSGPL